MKPSTSNPTEKANHRSFIVGIGASAGGLQALKEFFDNVHASCEHSFVIIQHLSPDYKSLMAELLGKNSELPVQEAKHKMPVELGNIYLLPPKKNMTIVDGILMLTDKPTGHELNMPIDIFLRSLAEDQKENAIAVILSGSGSDGTRGVKAIKEMGGMVMVQKPEEAKFDGMPRSAIATGLIDFILPVDEIPKELVSYIQHPIIHSLGIEEEIGKDSKSVERILRHIRAVTDIDFEQYKRPTLIRRMARRMSINKCQDLGDYLDFMHDNPKEVQVLYREFLIGVTKFFRDPEVWQSLSEIHLPRLLKSVESKELIKVWCVGTSTGEEAYSVAITILELLHKLKLDVEVKIFATDIEKQSLDVASRGIYPESIVADISPERLKEYFIKKGEHYQVKEKVRRLVIFSQHNILTDPPFYKMDLVLCRNMLIYLKPEAQHKVVSKLHYSMNIGALMLVGKSGSIGEYKKVLKPVGGKEKIFRSTEASKSTGSFLVHNPEIKRLKPKTAVLSRRMTVETRMSEVMNELVSDQLNIAGVFVDRDFDILHAVGELKQFIEFPDKGFSMNLVKMLPDKLAVACSTAVRRSANEKDKVLYKDLKVKKGKKLFTLDLLVQPFLVDSMSSNHNFLILFIPKDISPTASAILEVEELEDGLSGLRIAELEEELKDTRESLQSTVEEVETSNEELQATNEELLSANEELQSTNEELQSVNEELHTVNAEHQQKIEDLAELNADMDNLLASTEIGTIFLDADMKIRKFTPSIRSQFNLHESDIDRPIDSFRSSVGNENIIADAASVVHSLEPSEKQIEAQNGRHYLRRIMPYRNSNDEKDGVVISFVDITNFINKKK